MSSDLVKRLRLWGEHGLTSAPSDLVDAADRIEALEGEVQRYKALLDEEERACEKAIITATKAEYRAAEASDGVEPTVGQRLIKAAKEAAAIAKGGAPAAALAEYTGGMNDLCVSKTTASDGVDKAAGKDTAVEPEAIERSAPAATRNGAA
jgi:hypothetical protein